MPHSTTEKQSLEKLATGIPGYDELSHGGLPKGRTTLLGGTAGSGKTIFAVQFLVEGITRHNEGGVFVTFEESPEDIRKNVGGFGWDIAAWEKAGRWVFVDASPQPGDGTIVTGDFDLTALVTRIERAAKKIGAQRVSVDSLGALFTQIQDDALLRREMHRLSAALKDHGLTTVMTAERTKEYGDISRFGIEEFVADNVTILRNVLSEEKRRRTVEILKYRGSNHQEGEYPFTVLSERGLVALPLSAIQLKQKSSVVRVTSGNPELDAMCGGGFFRDSIILLSGATGTGKTLVTTQFIEGGAKKGERGLLFEFEESREQLFRNATGWGTDFERMEKEGMLKVVCEYPEVSSLESHLLRMKDLIDEFKPSRIAIDSLSALERVAPVKGFREFVISLTSFIKHQETVGLFTATTPTLVGGTSVTEAHISTLTDSIILLRYVELRGEMHRGLMVLKMRGSPHNKAIREFTIDGTGMHIGEPFRDVSGILAGNVHQVRPAGVIHGQL
ncbi:MAG: putative circadian clock protein KaiC [Phycisphaerales bacterium]|nr:putative circadian clock protein KaiC [Phycisphaerales bacterium]